MDFTFLSPEIISEIQVRDVNSRSGKKYFSSCVRKSNA